MMLLRRNLSRILALKVFVLSIGFCSVSAYTAPPAHQPQDQVRTIKLPLDEWLGQGEHTEIAWKVSLSRPSLTYQLRSLVRVTAEVPADVLQKQGIAHDLHFIVKAAPEHGAWDPEESYSRFRVEAALDPRSELQMLAELYLQPGEYTIATAVYDATSGRRNLSFNRVQVGDSDREAFPHLLGSIPKIQFLPPPDDAAPLGWGRISLPVVTQRPVQLTLIVDLSTQEQEAEDVGRSHRRSSSYPPYLSDSPWGQSPDARAEQELGGRPNRELYEQTRLLEAATLLSGVDLNQGCIHVAALDILRQRTVLPLTAAPEVGWGKIRDEILSPDRAMVSVGDLKGRRYAAKFFEQELERTMAQPLSCQLASQNSLQVIVILSRGISFPSGSDKPRIQPGCNCKVFYLQQNEGGGGPDLRNLLKPLSPVVLEFSNPLDFRQKLLEFAHAMERLP